MMNGKETLAFLDLARDFLKTAGALEEEARGSTEQTSKLNSRADTCRIVAGRIEELLRELNA